VSKLSISPKEARAETVVDDDDAEAQETVAAVVVVEDDEAAAKKPELPPNAKLNEDGTVTLTLTRTITITVKKGQKVAEENYTELTFRELTGLDRRVVSQAPESQQEVLFVARSTGISSARMNAVWDKLGMRDIKRIEKVATFLSE
jgi:mRNA-degrading endonuclease toxin of MazEF toxin-antitoxin module